MSDKPIKLFVSYSWKPATHEAWVIELATTLRQAGVDVILDKWDLKEGQDAHKFMEQMVADKEIRKVAIICSKTYIEKANDRKGGVGTETQIMTPEIYQSADQTKFVAVVAEKDETGQPYLPIFYQSRVFIDLSDPDQFSTNFEQLLRWIYDKPLHVKPDLGPKPAFLSENPGPSLNTTPIFTRTLDAIRSDKPFWAGALSEYFDRFADNLEKFRINLGEGDTDDKVAESISQFLPYRNEAIELFLAIAQYKNSAEAHRLLHRFFEKLLPYYEPPADIGGYSKWDFDNFKFLIHELFLYCVASFQKYEAFEGVSYLLDQYYYIGKNYDQDGMVPFSELREHMISFRAREQRLRRLSSRADLLEERCKSSGFQFNQLMQADCTLFIRGCVNVLNENDLRRFMWWPETFPYLFNFRGTAFEIFARAQSQSYFKRLAPMLGISTKGDLTPLKEAFETGKLKVPSWEHISFEPMVLIGYDKLAIRD